MYDEEAIHSAEIERSFRAVAETWERDDITVDKMTAQLEELVAIIDSESDYNRLINKLKIKDIKNS